MVVLLALLSPIWLVLFLLLAVLGSVFDLLTFLFYALTIGGFGCAKVLCWRRSKADAGQTVEVKRDATYFNDRTMQNEIGTVTQITDHYIIGDWEKVDMCCCMHEL